MNRVADLFNPPDLMIAYREWKANCGPCALAALIGVPVMAVRDCFPDFPRKAWCNPTLMRAALAKRGVTYQAAAGQGQRFPAHGLAFLQLEGPWEDPGVPVTVAYRHTHWVAVSGEQVYDANATEWGHRDEWETWVMPDIVAHTKRATGWRVRTALEVAS